MAGLHTKPTLHLMRCSSRGLRLVQPAGCLRLRHVDQQQIALPFFLECCPLPGLAAEGVHLAEDRKLDQLAFHGVSGVQPQRLNGRQNIAGRLHLGHPAKRIGVAVRVGGRGRGAVIRLHRQAFFHGAQQVILFDRL